MRVKLYLSNTFVEGQKINKSKEKFKLLKYSVLLCGVF